MGENELPGLRTMVAAGEVCTSEIADRWARERRFINAYGPTEATVCATYGMRSVGEEKAAIGRPLWNIEVYLTDEQMESVPVGVGGQMQVGGVGVARGYIGRAELTAEKFIPNPFSKEGSGRMYRTGDMGRYLGNGEIEFLGRTDNQVKVRGYRIELGEVEATLRKHGGVREAVVVVGENPGGDKRLDPYVVAEQGEQAGRGESLELWPSVAEYFVYDEMLYHAMTMTREATGHIEAIKRAVKDKVVVDIGTVRKRCWRGIVWKGSASSVCDRVAGGDIPTSKGGGGRRGLEEKIVLIQETRGRWSCQKRWMCASEIVGPIGGGGSRRDIERGAAVYEGRRRDDTAVEQDTGRGVSLQRVYGGAWIQRDGKRICDEDLRGGRKEI
jgi:acyl-CoA synthetase (AMP-forming)/AMP-acid ligase II